MEVPENLPPPAEEVERDREEGTSEEKPQETAVHGAGTEHLLGSKSTPDDCSGEGSVNTGAGEVIPLLRRANIRDLRHLVVEDSRADETGNKSSEHLGAEGDPRRNVNVVSELEILGKVEGVRGGNVSIGLEIHHRVGVTGEPETTEQLGDNIEGHLDVGNSLDYATRNAEDGGDENTVQRSSGGGGGRVNSDGSRTRADGDTQYEEVGPLRHLSVRPHQAGVYVFRVFES